jgi:hypothetical protein
MSVKSLKVEIAPGELIDKITILEIKSERMDFGETFIGLARAVYQTNDERARLKREINVLLGSEIIEEKSYKPY